MKNYKYVVYQINRKTQLKRILFISIRFLKKKFIKDLDPINFEGYGLVIL